MAETKTPNFMPMPGPIPGPTPYDSPVQRFRDAVKGAAETLLMETGICPAEVKMAWSETKTGNRVLQKLVVGFATDEIDGYDLIYPCYQTSNVTGDEPQL